MHPCVHNRIQNTEECEIRKCIRTAAASCAEELDRVDGIRMATFGPRNIYLRGPIISRARYTSSTGTQLVKSRHMHPNETT